MNVRILTDAEFEIDDARNFLNQQKPGLGFQFIIELAETFAEVANRPTSFSKVETLCDDLPYRRALLAKFRYAVIFEVAETEIIVVAVAHCSRAPNYWIRRPDRNSEF